MQTLDNVKNKLDETVNDAKKTVSTAQSKAIDFSTTLKEKAGELGATVKNESVNLAKKARDKTLAVNEAAIEAIRNNPYKSVGVALAIGFAIAKYRNLKAAVASGKNA